MRTHDLGRLFVHAIHLKTGSARIHRANTHELEYPYRISRSWVFRIWGERGFVLGYWSDQDLSEKEALLAAMQGGETELLDDHGHIKSSYEPERGQEGTCEPRRDARTPAGTWDTGTVSTGA